MNMVMTEAYDKCVGDTKMKMFMTSSNWFDALWFDSDDIGWSYCQKQSCN